MDIFTDVVDPKRQHPYYRYLKTPDIFKGEIEVLHDWTNGFVDRDGKFVIEFQTTFNSSFWELYLFACFKQLGFVIDFSHETPDFLVSAPNSTFIAEASISCPPQGFVPEWCNEQKLKRMDQPTIDAIVKHSTLRLANTISSKYKKYLETYKALDHVVGRPFVLCIAPFDYPAFWIQNQQAIRRVVYGIDMPIHIDDLDRGERMILDEPFIEEEVNKNGSIIPLGLFTNDRMKEISAIIFSTTATFCKLRALNRNPLYPILFIAQRYDKNSLTSKIIEAPKEDYHETLLDGINMYINPFAEIPLDLSPFVNREIAINMFDPARGEYFSNECDGALLQRRCIGRPPANLVSIMQENGAAILSDAPSIDKLKTVTSEKWQEDELLPVRGNAAMFVDNHMAHFKGWTIIVARHEVDNDWSVQAIHSICQSIQEYININRSKKASSIQVMENYFSKEEAYEAIKKRISESEDHPNIRG